MYSQISHDRVNWSRFFAWQRRLGSLFNEYPSIRISHHLCRPGRISEPAVDHSQGVDRRLMYPRYGMLSLGLCPRRLSQCAMYVDMAIFCFSYNGRLRALSGTSVTLSIIFFLPQAYVLTFFWITRPIPEPFRQCTNCSLRVDKSSVRFRKITALPPLSCHLHYALCSPSEI